MNAIKKWLQTSPSLAAAIRSGDGGSHAPNSHMSNSNPRPPRKKMGIAHPLWRQSARAGLLCTIVLMSYALVGMIAYHLYYHFWFLTFLILFTPVWLVCYGLIFASRFRWHELSLGVFSALFLMTTLYLHNIEDESFRLVTALSFAGGGVLSVSLGFWTAVLFRTIFRTQKRPGS